VVPAVVVAIVAAATATAAIAAVAVVVGSTPVPAAPVASVVAAVVWSAAFVLLLGSGVHVVVGVGVCAATGTARPSRPQVRRPADRAETLRRAASASVFTF